MSTTSELTPNTNIWGHSRQMNGMNHVEVESSVWFGSESSDFTKSTGSETSDSSDSDSSRFDTDGSSVNSVKSFRSISTCTLVGCTDICIHYQQSLERKIDNLTSDIEDLNHSMTVQDRDTEHQKLNTNQMEFTIDALKGEMAMLEHALQTKTVLVEAEVKERTQQADEITMLHNYIKNLHNNVKSVCHKTQNASEAKIRQNALEDELSRSQLALEDEQERRQGLEEHIIDMGRRKYMLKQENRKMRLAIVEKDKSLERCLAEKECLRTKMVELEQEIEELRAQVSGLLKDTETKNCFGTAFMKKLEDEGGEGRAGGVLVNDEVVLLEIRKALLGHVSRKELNKATLAIFQRLRKLRKL